VEEEPSADAAHGSGAGDKEEGMQHWPRQECEWTCHLRRMDLHRHKIWTYTSSMLIVCCPDYMRHKSYEVGSKAQGSKQDA
jgi:hypothetical protein